MLVFAPKRDYRRFFGSSTDASDYPACAVPILVWWVALASMSSDEVASEPACCTLAKRFSALKHIGRFGSEQLLEIFYKSHCVKFSLIRNFPEPELDDERIAGDNGLSDLRVALFLVQEDVNLRR